MPLSPPHQNARRAEQQVDLFVRSVNLNLTVGLALPCYLTPLPLPNKQYSYLAVRRPVPLLRHSADAEYKCGYAVKWWLALLRLVLIKNNQTRFVCAGSPLSCPIHITLNHKPPLFLAVMLAAPQYPPQNTPSLGSHVVDLRLLLS